MFESDKVILMPLFVSFYDYYSVFRKHLQNEKVLCNIVKLLIDGTEELLSLGFINIDLKMNNVMVDKNNRLKIIDFGLVVSEKRIKESMDFNIKYYIWPRDNNFTFGMVLSYMVVVFVLEVLYEDSVFSLHKKNNLISIIENNIKITRYFSDNFKEIIISVLKDGIEYTDFKNRMQPLFDKYEIKEGKIPDLYSLLLWNKGLDIF